MPAATAQADSGSEAVAAALAGPEGCFVGIGLAADPQVVRDRAACQDAGGLFVAATARTVVAVDLAHVFSQALAARLGLELERAEALASALQEALANAVIHGSLEMSGLSRESLEAFQNFSETMDRRLADPAHGGRPVEVAARWDDALIEVLVADRGSGYLPVDLAERPLREASGRGLTMIADLADGGVAFAERGRRLTMKFRR